jgi:hypothetical protein
MATGAARNSCALKSRRPRLPPECETREHFALQCARISMANSMNLVTQAIADHWYVHAHLVGNAVEQQENGRTAAYMAYRAESERLPAPPTSRAECRWCSTRSY